MIVSFGIRANAASGGSPRRGWLVYHLRGEQSTYVGFIDYAEHPNWSQIRHALPGLIALGQVDVEPKQYRELYQQRMYPADMARVVSALEGN